MLPLPEQSAVSGEQSVHTGEPSVRHSRHGAGDCEGAEEAEEAEEEEGSNVQKAAEWLFGGTREREEGISLSLIFTHSAPVSAAADKTAGH